MMRFMHAAAAVLVQDRGLTLHDILVDIPHDAAAIVVYLLSAGAIFWVFKAGLKKPDAEDRDPR